MKRRDENWLLRFVGARKHFNKRAMVLICLHVLLLIYSLSGIFSKTAAAKPFLSMPFIVLYGCMLLVLFVYAIGWQQVIKRLPLTLAFMNKAVTIVWGVVWGCFFFGEELNVGKMLGAALVVIGVIVFAKADGGQNASADALDRCNAECGRRS